MDSDLHQVSAKEAKLQWKVPDEIAGLSLTMGGSDERKVMDSDLRILMSEELAQLQWERRERESANADAKAQRRADLVTLTAGAIGGLAGGGFFAQWSPEKVAERAVDMAEAALTEIERRLLASGETIDVHEDDGGEAVTDFVFQARTDVPDLCDTVEALRAELAEARQVIHEFKAAHSLNGWDNAALFLALIRAKGSGQ